MLKRDFTKSNKEYFAKNKVLLITLALFVLVSIVIIAVFGFNGNFEFKNSYQFTVNTGEITSKQYSDYSKQISNIASDYNANLDTISIFDEGDSTMLIVRYTNAQSASKQTEINTKIASKLELDESKISEHLTVSPVVRATDYVYTACAVLILITAATLFAYFRYNGASALAVMLACLLGSLFFICITGLIRLHIGLSYFAMIVLLNLLISYFAINIFETMKQGSWLASGNFGEALEQAINQSRFRMCFLSIGVLLIGLLFVILAPIALKYVAINIMFVAVVALFAGSIIVPFVWNTLIPKCKKRENNRVKATLDNN